MGSKWVGKVCHAATKKGSQLKKAKNGGKKPKKAEIKMQKATKTKRLDNRREQQW